MSKLSKLLVGLIAGAQAQKTYVTTFGDKDGDGPVWEMEFDAESDEAAAQIAENESIEKLMMQDDLGTQMLQLEQVLEARQNNLARRGGEMSEGDLENLNALRRFKNLKAMVMSLQPPEVVVFGRYCYYGCWCLPQGQHNLASGYGAPVDAVDAVCKEFALCYKCLDIDFGGACNPEKRGYKWKKIKDVNTNEAYDVQCENQPETGPSHRCARYTCECDRILAVGLAEVYSVWNITYHARWTPLQPDHPDYFNKENDCVISGGDYKQDACCGAYGSATADVHGHSNAGTGKWPLKPYSRRPYATTNPGNGCCQDAAIYNTIDQVCCVDDNDSSVSVVNDGECTGTVVDADEIGDFGYAKK